MRSDIGRDQAEGLRRLLARARHDEAAPSGAEVHAAHLFKQSAGYGSSKPKTCTQVINVVAGRQEHIGTTINLAAALTCSGKDVLLVLDGNRAPDNLLHRFGLYAKHELLDVIRGRCAPHEALLTGNGFSVLCTARVMNGFSRLDQTEQQRMAEALAKVSGEADVVLVDAAMPVLSQPKQTAVSSSLQSGTTLLVVDATASGITESYALIKRLVLENACSHFEIMVNKAGDERAAMTVFGNMAKLALRNLAARLEYLGYIPDDDGLKRATRMGRSVVEAFPSAVSAKLYVESAQKLLRLQVRHDGVEGGISRVMQNLIRQLAHQRSSGIAHVVN